MSNSIDTKKAEGFAEGLIDVLNKGSLAQDGAGLGTMWGEEKAKEMLKEAGFKNIEVRRLSHDFQNNFYINMKK